MRISRTTLSCLLRVKGYVAVRVGSAFRAAHSSRFLLHLFHPCPPVFPPGSAFAFTYILCLRSRSSIGAFIISPLPPCFQSRYRQQGRFPPPALPGFTGTTNPSATLSPVSRLPGAPGYTAYLAPPISRRGEEGFSSCLARPRYRAVATTPPECRSALASLRYAMLLSSRTWGLSLRVFFRGHLCVHSRYGPATRRPPLTVAVSMGFRSSFSLLPAIHATGLWLLPRRVCPPLNAPAFAGRTNPEMPPIRTATTTLSVVAATPTTIELRAP